MATAGDDHGAGSEARPPLDADTAEMLAALAALGAPGLSEGTVERARANYNAAPKPPRETLPRVEDRVIPGNGHGHAGAGAGGGHDEIPVRVYATTVTPQEQDGSSALLPIVVFFHGGGWVLSNIEGHDSTARRIAARSGALVVSVDYRLAPESPFPAPHDDCFAATAWLAVHGKEWGGDRSRIAVCGDSAGGNLAAGVALRARDEGIKLVLQVLIYPCIDDRQSDYPSMTENAAGYLLRAVDMVWFWNHFVPTEESRNDPRAVPARASNLAGVAPAFVQTADYDPLRDEAERYAERMAADGVPVKLVRYPGVIHGFMSRWHKIARAEVAHDDLAAALRAAFDA